MGQIVQGEFLFFDGAMGTMLQEAGLEAGGLPELLNLEGPELITSIHAAYVKAGADVVTTNTFQASRLKLPEGVDVGEIIRAGVRCAKAANPKFVALDVGPLGQLMEPMGDLTIEQAYELFREQMVAGEQAGADLILLETFSDLHEAKTAILAAKENTHLPVICTMTFQADGRTFTGTDALSAVFTLEGLGVEALGVNCSMGPEELLPIVREMLKYSRVPVIVQANAGLPELCCGKAKYVISPAAYAEKVVEMAKTGARILGGCCGTTPEFITAVRQALSGMKPVEVQAQKVSACTSGNRALMLNGRTTVIGERLNPTGKKKLKEALRKGDMDYLLSEALAQKENGCDALDVNVGLPEIDEPEVLKKAVRSIQAVCGLPLQIDSADPAAIEAAVRAYNGKPIINSVNGKRDVMEKIFPIAKKYGALVVGLTLDEAGIPETAEGRIEIARRMVECAEAYGVSKEDLVIDCLVLTASAQQQQVRETLRAVSLVKRELGMMTVLGVSNVSFGLPSREVLNQTFLAAALGAGLDAAILNPMAVRYREVVDSYRVLSGEDVNAEKYVAGYAQVEKPEKKVDSEEMGLREIILQGRSQMAAPMVEKMLGKMDGLEIINEYFVPALDVVGKKFEKGELFLPQLMQSAQAVTNGLEVIKRAEKMKGDGEKRQSKGKVLIATVEGDIHDIGKNIVKMLMESHGFEVVDLGKDVKVEEVVRGIREHGVRLCGLSALMTTTVGSMKRTIERVREEGIECTFFVGGAVLTEEYANFVGADYYAKDAVESVRIANEFFMHT